VLSTLSLLGKAQGSVEPIVLSSLGRATRETFDRIDSSWRELMADQRRI
jgi:hypothetical protein